MTTDLCPVCELMPADSAYLGTCCQGCERTRCAEADELERIRSQSAECFAEAA